MKIRIHSEVRKFIGMKAFLLIASVSSMSLSVGLTERSDSTFKKQVVVEDSVEQYIGRKIEVGPRITESGRCVFILRDSEVILQDLNHEFLLDTSMIIAQPTEIINDLNLAQLYHN